MPKLIIETSNDGSTWDKIAEMDGYVYVILPTMIFSDKQFVKISVVKTEEESSGTE